jgi:hypothetical protein
MCRKNGETRLVGAAPEGADGCRGHVLRIFLSLDCRLSVLQERTDVTENDLLVSCQVYGKIGIHFCFILLTVR